MVLLPDHLHCIWKLPEEDADFSVRWSCIKKAFTQSWIKAGGQEGAIPRYRGKLRERGIWQRRFWEHTIRNEDDFIKHVNYIHYNPVKHNLVTCPHLWPYSSFHRWVEEGYYAPDWLCDCEKRNIQAPDFADTENNVGEQQFVAVNENVLVCRAYPTSLRHWAGSWATHIIHGSPSPVPAAGLFFGYDDPV